MDLLVDTTKFKLPSFSSLIVLTDTSVLSLILLSKILVSSFCSATLSLVLVMFLLFLVILTFGFLVIVELS
jgi:hypothetical protein